ncbi:MAG TPA: hypothetical protein VD833_21275 [Vicinamibacterales bacterium]|nr:hypothetical protein [Vicinamibacterales bacterium]
MLHSPPIQLAYVLAAEVLEQVPVHQLLAERNENPVLDLLAADGQTVRAGAARSGGEAREAIAPIHHVPATVLGALRQTGEEILRTACFIESLRIAVRCDVTHLDLPRLHLVPQLVLDDSQFGNRGRHPVGRRVWSRDALARIRILDVAKTIPHKSSDAQLVVQDSGAASRIAVDGAGIPEFDAPAQSSPRLVGKVFQEERVHRALQTEMQMRDVPFRERDDVHASEREPLEESSGVLLVPAESIQRLCGHDIEPLVQRVSHQRLETGPKQRGTRDRVIRELLNNRPALASCELPAHRS